MSVLVPAVAGALVTGGLLLVAVGLTKAPPRPARTRSRARRIRLSRRTRTLLLVGAVIGAVVAVLTGWVVAVVIVPAATAGLPLLLSAPPAEQELKRLEAMEEWVRSIAGVLTAGVGLEQALITSLRSTPEAIKPEIARLVGRLRSRWDTPTALRLLADDLDDTTGDLIAANLLLGARRRGGGLAPILDALAESVGQEVRARREIEADRAKPRSNARLITGISVAVLGFLAFSGDYVAPYGSPFGQALLLVLLVCYVAALVWMRVMARGKPMPRFIGTQVRRAGT